MDIPSAQVVLDEVAIKAKVPELAAGFQIVHDTVTDYSPPTNALRLKLHDGRLMWLDMTPRLHARPPPNEPWKPGHFCGPDGGARPSCVRRHCYAFASVPGTSGLRMGSASLWGRPKIQSILLRDLIDIITKKDGGRSALKDGSVLLRPAWVRLLESECVFEHSAPRPLVVVQLGAEQRLAHDTDDHLIPISIRLAEPTQLAQGADHPQRQRVEEVLRLSRQTARSRSPCASLERMVQPTSSFGPCSSCAAWPGLSLGLASIWFVTRGSLPPAPSDARSSSLARRRPHSQRCDPRFIPHARAAPPSITPAMGAAPRARVGA
jgi:hypothetical protein